MNSIPELIEKLGGSTAIARSLGMQSMTTVASWKSRRVIPVEYWDGLLGVAWKRGITDLSYEKLVKLHTQRAA